MLAKIIGKNITTDILSVDPDTVTIDGKVVHNPTEEQLKKIGYKELITKEKQFTKEKQLFGIKTVSTVSTLVEKEDRIEQVLSIVPAQPDYTEAILEMQKTALLKQVSESEDKTIGIQCMALFDVYVQNRQHDAGEVATSPETGYPYECMISYDGTVQQDWTIDNRTLWKPWHSRKKEYALPWEQPTGAHDMYKAGEYMIWTDGKVYQCVTDTNYSPDEYRQAWEET